MNAQIDITRVRLETPRLILRPWRETDLEDLYEYARVDGVGQMAGWIPHASIQVSENILKSFITGRKTFAIEMDGKVIGSLGVERYRESFYPEFAQLRGREIGYVLSKDYWGRGLMPEAVQAVVQYLFAEEDLDFVLVGHFSWNRQSARVIEKCGFRHIRTVPYDTHYGTREDSVEYILWSERGNTHAGA